jgi:hypothetical protein
LRRWAIIPLGVTLLWIVMAAVEAALDMNQVRVYFGADFTCFWAAGALLHHGAAATVYDGATLAAAEHAARVMPAGVNGLPFYYPPPYLLLCWLLGALPYWAALAAYLSGGVLLVVVAAHKLAPAGTGWLPVLVFPGLLVSARTGQNGVLVAACFAWFAVLADRRPLLAGACLGLLVCKPQFAVCAPLALLAAGRWRCLAGAAAAVALLCLASLAAFGIAPWLAFLHHLGAATDNITVGIQDRAKIMSAFNTARLLGAGLGMATTVHAVLAVPAVLALVWFARQRPDGAALGGALAAASLLATPYMMDYDLVCLAPALAAATARGARDGFAPGDKILLLAAYILPFLAHDIAASTRVQVAPLVIAGLLFVLVRPSFVARPVAMARA